MKRKTIYFVGMVLGGLACIYFAFEAKPVFKLWHWFGYTFSIGNPVENWVPKLSFATFLMLYLRELGRENKKS
jgi:hypothetical protein